MTVSTSSFKDRFAQFANTDDDLVQLVLDEASSQVNRTVWGSRADEGILYLAAHLLEIDAYGEASRLNDDTKQTTFERHFKRLIQQVTVGKRNA